MVCRTNSKSCNNYFEVVYSSLSTFTLDIPLIVKTLNVNVRKLIVPKSNQKGILPIETQGDK
jgi:hypothetical protein